MAEVKDWTTLLTATERADIRETDYGSATTTELQDLHLGALRTIAALRALVAEKDKGIAALDEPCAYPVDHGNPPDKPKVGRELHCIYCGENVDDNTKESLAPHQDECPWRR